MRAEGAAACMQNHERDSPFTGDNFNNTEADSGGECDCSVHRTAQPRCKENARFPKMIHKCCKSCM